MLVLDHVAYGCRDLGAGAGQVAAALGADLPGAGRHGVMGTWNRLMGLGPDYLEVIAVDPAASAPIFPRWFDLDRFDGDLRLCAWICRCDDLEAALAAAPPGMGRILRFERGPYRWRMAVPWDGALPFGGLFPALIQWDCAAHPAAALADSGLALAGIEITSPFADDLRAALGGLLADRRVTVLPGASPGMRAGYRRAEGAVTWL